jgi:hypothetical protein
MAATANRNPARRIPETSSLMGVLELNPRPVIVLVFLTITIAVVGWRMFQGSGASRMDALTVEAMRVFAAAPEQDAASAAPETEEAEKKILELTGVSMDLPPAESGFLVTGLGRETVRNRTAAALRFRYDGGYYLLVVFRREGFLGGKTRAAFPEESLLSGERDGKSFVLWEREGASFIMVSDVDVIQAFGLVRRFFT